MSNPGSNPKVEELIAEGIKAARAGNKTAARTLLEQAVELDQYSEKGWFWLASVVDTPEEQRVCLGNVVVINPNNQRAQNLLAQLESQQAAPQAASSSSGTKGVNRKVMYAAVGLSVTALVVFCLVIFAGGKGNNNKGTPSLGPANTSATQPEGSVAAIVGTDRVTETTTVQPALTPTVISLPPTWTSVPTLTPLPSAIGTPLAPPPAGLGGRIIMRSGRVVGDENNQPIVLLNADGSNAQTISAEGERGHAPVLAPDGDHYAYIRYAPGTGDVILETNNLAGTDLQWANARWGGSPILTEQDTPAWSPDGQWIAFAARESGEKAAGLFRLSMVGPVGDAANLQRLTNDDVAESWPAWSPDSRFIVYAADFTPTGTAVTELRIYNIANGQITNLTTNGAALIESAPDWSPNGKYIVFQAQESGSSNPDIYWMTADGLTPPKKIIASDAADIVPRFSPDGQYIAFSSNRAGDWDVFVYEIATGTIYQVTTGAETDVANGWGN